MSSLIQLDKAHVWHPFTQMRDWVAPDHQPLMLVAGRGAWLEDSLGRRYLDGNSSIWTNIHGHGHPVLNQAIREQLNQVAHTSFLGFTNPKAVELAVSLVGLLPGSSLTKVFFSDDGSTAVEVAIKMAVQYFLQTNARGRQDSFLLKTPITETRSALPVSVEFPCSMANSSRIHFLSRELDRWTLSPR